ncbi:MAG: hypothetical protein HKL87_05250 [Acidimicrobiaceae bacterium]|nr:hypothetical protein [Acidimicrobiaceae bacterium]
MSSIHRAPSVVSRVRASVRWDLSLLTPVRGLVTALPVGACVAVALALHNPSAAVVMGVAANLVAIISLVGAPVVPLRFAVADGVLMAISVVLGNLTAGVTWLHLALLVPWCVVAGAAVSLGLTPGVMGSQAIVAYVVLGRFADSPHQALHVGVLFLCGALIEITALLLLRLPPSLRHQRQTLGVALRGVADYARAPASTSGFPALNLVDQARRVLTSSSLLGRSDARDLRSVVESLRRVRLGLVTLNGLREQFSDPPGLADYLTRLGDALDTSAKLVEHRLSARALDHVHEELLRARATITSVDSSPAAALIERRLDDLDDALEELRRYLLEESEDVVEGAWRVDVRWRRPRADSWRTPLGVLLETLRTDNPARRHAIRLTLAVITADVVAHVFSLPRGYWVAFSVAVILKPDYSTLFSRGVGRVVGTVLGATLAALLIALLQPSPALSALIIFVLATLAYATWAASFAVSIGLVTSVVLFLLSLTLTNSYSTAVDRLLDVTIGAVLSFATYLLWPSPAGTDTETALEHLSESLRTYLSLTFDALDDHPDTTRLRAASRSAHFRFHEATLAHGRDLVEPDRDPDLLALHQSRLDGGRRLLRAIHTLRFEAESGVRQTPEELGLAPGPESPDETLSPEIRLIADEIAVSRTRLEGTNESR